RVTGRLVTMLPVPHLLQTLPAGALIGPSDVEMRLVPAHRLGPDAALTLEDVVGMAVRRARRAGGMLGPNDVAAPMLVARNQTVTLTYRAGALTLTARGQALSAAAGGQPVAVLTLMSKKVIQGIVAGPGAVSVSPMTMQLAEAL
ncbi:MAG TPA: flagellar basal body P-ring formation chaperone FlgA, partial [Devosiaceae bacterium]|nr:flagellar basal body P-ring formation chaperone FlgA [Devosiaceae bacterium]